MSNKWLCLVRSDCARPFVPVLQCVFGWVSQAALLQSLADGGSEASARPKDGCIVLVLILHSFWLDFSGKFAEAGRWPFFGKRKQGVFFYFFSRLYSVVEPCSFHPWKNTMSTRHVSVIGIHVHFAFIPLHS